MFVIQNLFDCHNVLYLRTFLNICLKWFNRIGLCRFSNTAD